MSVSKCYVIMFLISDKLGFVCETYNINVALLPFPARDNSNEFTRLSQVIANNIQKITQNGEYYQ